MDGTGTRAVAPAVELPKLRDGLLVSHQVTAEDSFFVIKDPSTARFFRFREAEHFICQQLDGATPVAVIGRRIEEKFGSRLAPRQLENFIQTLARIGLLDVRRGESRDPALAKRWVRGSLLYLRFKAFDPDRLLNTLATKLRVFFTPHAVALTAFAVAWALVIAVVDRDDIRRDLGMLWRFDALLFAWVTVLLVTTLHEFAHGLTCKHFGGAVHEMGFMLIYFQPAFYCNVSDAWLFPEKSKRLWVTFAGAYFEIFLWALATLTWRVAAPATWVSFAAMVVMATSGIKCLFNLNPLIKLDGYYLLSDYLEIPNLRQKSIGYVRGVVGRAWGRTARPAEVTPRTRRIYVLYGVLAGAYSFLILTYVIRGFGNYLVARYQGLGLVLFGGFLMLLFRNTLRRIASRAAAPLRGFRMTRVMILLASAAILGLLLLGRMELKVTGEFTVLPIQSADIHAEVDGIVQNVVVDQGDVVEEGGLIAILSDREYSSELRKVTAELDQRHANLKKLVKGPRPEEINLASSEVGRVETRLRYARSDVSRLKPLAELGVASVKDLEDKEGLVAVLLKELEVARSGLGILLAGTRQEEIEAARAEIARLEVQREYLKEQLRLVRVVSPVAGVITTHNLKERIGQHVDKGDLITEVHELKTVKAEIAVPEKEIADVRVGQNVALRARAYPDLAFEGRVISIAPIVTKGEEQVERRTICVTTELDNAHLLLKAEMTGNAKIFCGKRRIIDLITRRLAQYVRVEFWSYW